MAESSVAETCVDYDGLEGIPRVATRLIQRRVGSHRASGRSYPLRRRGRSRGTGYSGRGIGLTSRGMIVPRGMTRRIHRKRCSPFVCQPCNRTYVRKDLYEKHMQLCHSGQSLVCHVCKTDMCCQYHYDVHVKRHTTRIEYVCQFCQRTSPTIDWLRIHVEEHIGQTPLLCDQCELDFQGKIELSATPKLMCFAPMIFKSIEELNVHIKFRHQTLVAVTADTSDLPPHYGDDSDGNHLHHWMDATSKQGHHMCSCCLRRYETDYDLQVHRERQATLRSNGTMGCGLYELFKLCLDGKYLNELGLREVKLRALLKHFLATGFNFKDKDFLYLSTELLLAKFCRQILDDDDLCDILYLTPINDLVSEMVFVLKEMWPLDQTYTGGHLKPKVEFL